MLLILRSILETTAWYNEASTYNDVGRIDGTDMETMVPKSPFVLSGPKTHATVISSPDSARS